MAPGKSNHRAFLVGIFLTTSFIAVLSNRQESEALVMFKNSLTNAGSALNNWTLSTDPCGEPQWAGVQCEDNNVLLLQLEGLSLKGSIDTDSLSSLRSLRSLSLAENNFEGPLPDFKKLVSLKALNLGQNRFRGKIPDDAFDGMTALRLVHLGRNRFTGEILKSLVKLPRLVNLGLEDNRFEGRIPDFHQGELEMVNVANNLLEGPIPKSLSKMNSTFFTGNKNLCGKPLRPCRS